MLHEKINLKEQFENLEHDVYLTSYCPDNYEEFSVGKKRKCVIVLPGGGYMFTSDREAEPVALRFTGHNIASFVLKYTIAPKIKYPYPYLEVLAAVAYVRRNADKYHIDENSISIIGFSAGGHLAGMSSAFHQKEEFAKVLNVNVEEMKINGCLLGYPVVSTTIGHTMTIKNATNYEPELMELLSVDKQITPSFPKTFIWHTTFDSCVDVKNSLLLADALSTNKVFYEMHIYPMLEHGQSLADDSVYNDNFPKEDLDLMRHNTQWMENAIHFIKKYV